MSLTHPLLSCDPTTPAALRWKARCIAGINPSSPQNSFNGFEASIAGTLFANDAMRQWAVQWCVNWLAAEKAKAAAGTLPTVAVGSYLYAKDYQLAFCYTLALCSDLLDAATKADFEAFQDQIVFNNWNAAQASFWGHAFPWSGWPFGDSGNNYTYSFLLGTAVWALYSGKQTWLDLLNNDKIPKLQTYLTTVIPEGGSKEGTYYGTAHRNLYHFYLIWLASTGVNLSLANSFVLNDILYWIYALTPGNAYLASFGDAARVSNMATYDYNQQLVKLAVVLNPTCSQASIGRWWIQNKFPIATQAENCWSDMLDTSGTATAPVATDYLAVGVGHYLFRSDWTDQANFLAFKCGDSIEAHDHLDNGSFQFWSNGSWLTATENELTKSGIQQATGWNSVLQFVTNSVTVQPNRTGRALATVAVSSSLVSIGANLDALYPAGYKWKRNLNWDRGSAIYVTDTYSMPANTYALWMLQSPVLPVVNGNVITAGRLRVTVNTPGCTIVIDDWKAANQDAIGGYRIDVRDPANGGVFDVTLNAMLTDTQRLALLNPVIDKLPNDVASLMNAFVSNVAAIRAIP